MLHHSFSSTANAFKRGISCISRGSNNLYCRHLPRNNSTTVDITITDPDVFVHTNSVVLPVTNKLEIVDTTTLDKWPVFRIMEPSGTVVNKELDPKFPKEEALKMYQTMVRIQCLDDVFYNAQRQGRISFYMQSAGEEAIHIGKIF